MDETKNIMQGMAATIPSPGHMEEIWDSLRISQGFVSFWAFS